MVGGGFRVGCFSNRVVIETLQSSTKGLRKFHMVVRMPSSI